jgi:prepilin-type N-terminal cleavage/methylation domain-containing protein
VNVHNNDGFTLLEMMIVILIVGILSAIAMATYTGAQNMGNNTDARTNLQNSITAAKSYYTGHDSSYSGMNAATLAEEVVGINFRDGNNPVTPGAVYVYGANGNQYGLKCKSLSGRVFTAIGDHLTVTLDY